MNECRVCRDVIFYSPNDLGISLFHLVIALGPCFLVVALLFKLERLNASLQYRASRSMVDMQQEHCERMSVSSPRRSVEKREERSRILVKSRSSCCQRCYARTKRMFVVGTKGTLIPQYYRIVVIAVASILVISIWSVIMNTTSDTDCTIKAESLKNQLADLFLRTFYRFSQFVALFALMSSCFRMVSSPSVIGFCWTFPIVASTIASLVPHIFTLIAHFAFGVDLRLESEVVLESCTNTTSPPDYKRSVSLWIFRDCYDSFIVLCVLFVYFIATQNSKPGVPPFLTFSFAGKSSSRENPDEHLPYIFIVYPRPSIKQYAIWLLVIRAFRLTAVVLYMSYKDSWAHVCVFAVPYFLENIILPVVMWVSLARDTAYLQGLRDETSKFEAALLGWGGNNMGNHTFEIDWREISLYRKLGEGQREVWAGTWLGTPVAIKKFPVLQNAPEMLWATRETHKLVRRAVLREVTILSSLSHPNIVQFLGCSLNVPATKSRERVRSSMRRRKRRGDSSTHIRQESEYEDAEEVWVVTELLKGRSLYEMIHQSRKTKLTLHYVLRLATDIAKGMVFLHSRNVTHCDLKSSNILLSAGSMNCKIIDFGESLVAGALSSEEDSHRGTLGWTSPELLNGSNDPSKQSDVWSFAVIVAEMLCRVHPVELMRDQAPSFAGMTTDHTDMKISKDAFMKWVRQGRSCALPDFLPDSLQAMLQKCWLPKPSERPSFANILLRLRRMQIKCRDDESWSKAEKMYEKYQAHFGIKHKNTEHEEEKMNSVLIEDEEKEDSALSTSPFSSSLLTPSIFAAETPTSVDQMSESSLRQALLSKPSVSV